MDNQTQTPIHIPLVEKSKAELVRIIEMMSEDMAWYVGERNRLLNTAPGRGKDFEAGFQAALKKIRTKVQQKFQHKRPTIVCLCGSTRFTVEMAAKSWELAKQGVIALGWNILLDGPAFPNGGESHGAEAEGVKEQIDELHKRKIDLADEVFVLNIGGYIGESTRSEIEYAEAHGKPVLYMEPGTRRPAAKGSVTP